MPVLDAFSVPNSKHCVWHAITTAVMGNIWLSSTAAGSRCSGDLLVATAAFGTIYSVTLLLLSVFRLLSQSQQANAKLAYLGVLMPGINVVAQWNTATPAGCRNWLVFYVFSIVMGTILADLPPAHSLVQWMLNAPFLL